MSNGSAHQIDMQPLIGAITHGRPVASLRCSEPQYHSAASLHPKVRVGARVTAIVHITNGMTSESRCISMRWEGGLAKAGPI